MGGFYSLVGKEKLNTRTICLPLAIASGSMNHQMTFCIEAALFSLNLKSHFPVEGYLDSGFVGNRSASTAPYQASGVFWAEYVLQNIMHPRFESTSTHFPL